MEKKTVLRVNIRPEVSILSVLRHLNYKPWFALAEFVDNSLQSYLSNQKLLKGSAPHLKVEIVLEGEAPGRIVVRDNAAGIAMSDFGRAFKPAEVPPNRKGLCEFGMGMKSAACWLANEWSVRTKALNETIERRVEFDVAHIVQRRIEDLNVHTRSAPAKDHFTELTLCSLHNIPQGRTISKIKDHLASIYRVFTRSGILKLVFNDEELIYEEPAILQAPFYKTPSGQVRTWRKEIDFDFGEGQKVHGFAALREKASVSSAGFALFRRNRLIQGGAEEGYRPTVIFGQSNSYTYQRLFGELHLEGFEVSHTKDGFRWAEHEEVFLELLAEHLDGDSLPLLAQAEGHRVRPSRQALSTGAKAAVDRTAKVVEDEIPQLLEEEIKDGPVTRPPPHSLPRASELASERTIDIELRGQLWRIILELSTDPAIGDWLGVSDRPPAKSPEGQRRCICVRMSLAHPFMERFGGTDAASIEPLLRVAAAIGLSETTAREAGVAMAGTIRRNINHLLRNALSKP